VAFTLAKGESGFSAAFPISCSLRKHRLRAVKHAIPFRTRATALFLATTLLAGCSLPRSGPTKNEIFEGSVLDAGNAYVVTVTDRVAEVTKSSPALGFEAGLINASALGSDTIQPGDTLGLVIWENVEDGLIASASSGGAPLEEIQVDGAGFIFVPYAGRIRAAGNTPEAVRRIITEIAHWRSRCTRRLPNRTAHSDAFGHAGPGWRHYVTTGNHPGYADTWPPQRYDLASRPL